MSLTDKQIQLARTLDSYVQQIVAQGGGDEEILRTMYDQMTTFKQLLDTSTPSQLNLLCQQYEGFYRFAKLSERLAQAIADGTIAVPRKNGR